MNRCVMISILVYVNIRCSFFLSFYVKKAVSFIEGCVVVSFVIKLYYSWSGYCVGVSFVFWVKVGFTFYSLWDFTAILFYWFWIYLDMIHMSNIPSFL